MTPHAPPETLSPHLSRRVFLRHGSLALLSLGFAPSFLARTLAAGARRPKLLVAVFQRGAVDGLNMVVPFGEPEYARLRPSIAIAAPGRELGALDLDGFFGLHPRLSPLVPFWTQQRLAIVHATGSPDATRSHFDAQDFMESATPGVKGTPDGWLNRTLQARRVDPEPPFRGVALTDQVPRSLLGRAPVFAMANLGRANAPVSGLAIESFEAQYSAAADAVLHDAGRDAAEAVRAMKQLDGQRYRPENGAEYTGTPFGRAMRQIAQLAKADVGLEIAFAEARGWDHHANEGGATGTLANRLDDFGKGLAALATDLGPRLDDTVILTMSEFGRTVAENGSRGTDHGHGNAMIAIGGAVKGGKVYGRWPGLAADRRYEGRDLAITTDFRDVFAEVVTRHLGVADARGVFPGYAVDPGRFPGLLG
jgi:uncharacterized protein (DUF1501 family)